jgi:uncharacterized protein YegL
MAPSENEPDSLQKRPGGTIARRELHVIWLLDTSGSMNAEGKIQSLNVAIHETIPHLRAAALANPNVQVLVRAITFSNGARWHIEKPTPVADLRWENVSAGGHTDLGLALKLLAEALRTPPMPERAVSPALILVTDGYHTNEADFEDGMAALQAERWGRQAVRKAIAIGRDVDITALKRFQGDDSEPLRVEDASTLVQAIRWTSRVGVEAASQLIDAGWSGSSADQAVVEW